MSAFYNENNPKMAAWLRELIKDGLIAKGEVDERSITEIQPNDLAGFIQCHFFAGLGGWSYALRLAGCGDDQEVWSGSCPCQPFSVAGKAETVGDERHLWPAFYRLIAECRPSVCFGEQVGGANGYEWLAGIRVDLEREGYAVGAADLCAAGVSAPHPRQRLYWVANANHARPERTGCGMQGEGRTAFGPANGREAGRMGHADERGLGAGSEQPIRCGEARPDSERRAERTSGTGERLVNTSGSGREERERSALAIQSQQRSAPDSGAWSDYDIIGFTNGKTRRIGSRFKWLVNGLSDTVVPLRDTRVEEHEREINAETDSSGCSKLLSPLPTVNDSQAIQNTDGGSDGFPKAQVLRPDLHGEMDDRTNKGEEQSQQSSPICETSERSMRAMRENKRASLCSPHRRESNEQYSRELEDIVRRVSQAIPLAVLDGDEETCKAMLILFPESWKDRPLPGSLSTYAEEWRPPSVEEVERAWKANHFKNFRNWARSPIKRNQEARAMRLHGYGNSIVPQVASQFIQAYCETLNSRP